MAECCLEEDFFDLVVSCEELGPWCSIYVRTWCTTFIFYTSYEVNEWMCKSIKSTMWLGRG